MRALRVAVPVVLIALGVASPAQASGGLVEEVASGLDSPRHLEFGSDGDLFVAEAGRGGTAPAASSAARARHAWAPPARSRRSTKARPSGACIAYGLALYANTPKNDNAIGPHGIKVLAGDAVLVTNGGPTEPPPRRRRVRPISRDPLAAQFPTPTGSAASCSSTRTWKPIRVFDTWALRA